ncbi:MAG: tripartite tricarboxylate transporter permease, partial [Planctomycetota bacterium]|nr:tripartite tricarboxylate transporter permease [Planctomycetota bacterium]
MTTLQHLGDGFTVALDPVNLLAALVGAILGLIVGALPGIGALTGVALLLPLTFSFNPTTAVIMLAAIYYANMYGGAYSAILLNIPGDSSAVMTALDGYPLAKQNKAGKALFTANAASFVGGTIGMVILTFIGPVMANVGIRFGPAEMASLLLVAMTSLGWLVGENPMKGIVSTCLGILFGTIGLDALVGSARFDFGVLELLGGVPFIPLVIGVFGFSQLITMMVDKDKPYDVAAGKLTIRESILDKGEVKRIGGTIVRSGLLGTVVGILPGAGGAIGSFLGYVMEKKIGRNRANMGKGALEGVAASEAANNSAVAGAFAPLLSLGIPGSGTTAVLLGGLIMWGLAPGPMLFRTS